MGMNGQRCPQQAPPGRPVPLALPAGLVLLTIANTRERYTPLAADPAAASPSCVTGAAAADPDRAALGEMAAKRGSVTFHLPPRSLGFGDWI